MSRTARGLVFCALLLVPGRVTAQVESGPKPGAKAEPFRSYVTTGNNPNRSADVVAEAKGGPAVFLFVQSERWTRPVARFLKKLDTALEDGVPGAEVASAVAVWLTDDADAAKQYQPRAQTSLMLTKTVLSVFEGPRTGPEGWSLYDDTPLTAVVVKGGKVVKSVTMGVMDEPNVSPLVEALKSP